MREYDRASGENAVKYIYKKMEKKAAEIIFFDSPDRVRREQNKRLKNYGDEDPFLDRNLWDKLRQAHSSPFRKQQENRMAQQRGMKLSDRLYHLLFAQQSSKVMGYPHNCIILPDFWADRASCLDYCINVFGHNPPQEWPVYQALAKHAGWIFPYKNFCLVCDRPIVLRLDNENRIHAEGEPAIQFADGFGIYVYREVELPEEYGKLHPSQWRVEWFLSEENAELRRVLIQGIGYARICQELQATPLDDWQEYQLLRIDNPVETEPMHLLKMTCPSTGYVHAMRVPPNIQSARSAIKWVNWGIDPSEFSVQT